MADLPEYLRADSAVESTVEVKMVFQLQAARVSTGSDGTVTWTFPQPYPSGVIPVISAVCEVGAGSVPYVVQIDGVISNTSVKLKVYRVANSGLIGIVGAALFSNPGVTTLHVTARIPNTV